MEHQTDREIDCAVEAEHDRAVDDHYEKLEWEYQLARVYFYIENYKLLRELYERGWTWLQIYHYVGHMVPDMWRDKKSFIIKTCQDFIHPGELTWLLLDVPEKDRVFEQCAFCEQVILRRLLIVLNNDRLACEECNAHELTEADRN